MIRAEIPQLDGCRILTRLKAFVADVGVQETLEHTFRERDGRVADLSAYFPGGSDSSESASETDRPEILVRVKEFLNQTSNQTNNPIWELEGEVVDAAKGVVTAQLTKSLVDKAGIYEMSWGVVSGGSPLKIDRAILSVERSLWPQQLEDARHDKGPPTLQELRMRIKDSSKSENPLLDATEFATEEFLLALAEPVRQWNEQIPKLRQYNTRTFPWRGAWILGVSAQLHILAANHYRRNMLKSQGGGVVIADKDKEREYLAEGQRLWAEYIEWLEHKSREINLKAFSGNVPSIYSALG